MDRTQACGACNEGSIPSEGTRKEITSQSSPPRYARRLARIVFSAQNGIRDFV